MEKYDLLHRQLIHEGTCEPKDFFSPATVDYDSVVAIHQKVYVQRLKDLQLNKTEIRKIGFPISKQLIDREFIIAGGTLTGSLKALKDGIAFNIAGGTHHAFSSHGEAFCLLNDQAIAAQYLLEKELAKRILIIDLDVHQGNGTAEIFRNEDRVFTFSMHGKKNYPFKKEKSDLDIDLEDKTNDKTYINIIKEVLPKLLKNIDPDFIFYLSGVDILKSDRLGRLWVSIEGCKERDQIVLKYCHDEGIAVQCSMGGGYSKDIKLIIEAHANTYRTAKKIY